MDRSAVIAACSVAAVSSFAAAWALVKLCLLKQQLRAVQEGRDDESVEREVRQQLVHHYVDMEHLDKLQDILPAQAAHYPERLATFCAEMCNKYKTNTLKVLDVGSGAGGVSFHLSKHFVEVQGVDSRHEMLLACKQLKDFRELASPLSTEGGKHIKVYRIAVPSECKGDNVSFLYGDLCSLPSNFNERFDCVLVSNILTELESPKEFLQHASSLVSPGGLLIIADPFLWPQGPEAKLGGDGTVKTSVTLAAVLEHSWRQCETTTMPFYVAQSECVARVANAQVSVWQRLPDPDSSDDNA